MVARKNFLNETEASNAFRRVTKWHFAGICLLATAFIVSSAVCLCLSYVNYAFYPDCILFSTWSCDKKPAHTDAKPQLFLNAKDTKWGKKSECYLTQFGLAAAAVASFILCWFFVFFRPTKEAYFFKKKTAASKLILPSVLICITFTITVFIATVTLHQGVKTWCQNYSLQTGHCVSQNESCSNVVHYTVINEHNQNKNDKGQSPDLNFYGFLVAAEVFSWLSSFVWLSNLFLLIVRCYLHLDFPAYFFQKDDIPYNNNTLQTETDSD